MTRVAPGGEGRWLATPILVAALAAFAGTLTGGVLYFRDLVLLHRPVRHLVRAAWAEGRLPLWEPLTDGGRALLANPQHRVLHPTALLDAVLPLDPAFAAAAILQVAIAGWGLALLLRDRGVDTGAARLGGIAYALSGPVLSLGNLPNLMGSQAWVPLVLWAGLRALQRPARWLGPAMLLAAVPYLAGGLEAVAAGAAVLAALALWEGSERRARLRRLGLVAAVQGGALLVAAVQVLPAVSALRNSERGFGLHSVQVWHWSAPPARLLETVVPGLWGVPTDPNLWWGEGVFDAGLPLILSTYLGAPVVLLAVVGLGVCLYRPPASPPAPALRRLVLALAALGALLGGAALGRFNPVLESIGAQWFAGGLLRYPERLLPLAALPVAAAAAAGWQQLRRCRQDRQALPVSAWVAAAGGAVLLGGVLLAAGAGAIPAGPLPPGRAAMAAAGVTAGAALALLAVVLTAACVWLAGRGAAARWSSWLAAVVVGLDLLAANSALNPTLDRHLAREVPSLAAALRDAGAPAPRLLREEEPAIPATGLAPGLEAVWARRSLAHRIPAEFGLATALASDVDRLAPPGNALLRGAWENAAGARRQRLADRAAAGWEILFGAPATGVPDAVFAAGVFPGAPAVVARRRESAAPRWHLVPRAVGVGALDRPGVLARLLAGMGDADALPEEVVFLAGAGAPSVDGGWAPGEGRVRAVSEQPDELGLRVDSPGAAVLVVRDSLVAGWSVSVDGEPARLWRADLAWRGVVLAAGGHEVRFRFRQPGLGVGASLTLLGLLVALGVPATCAWRRIRRLRPAPAVAGAR